MGFILTGGVKLGKFRVKSLLLPLFATIVVSTPVPSHAFFNMMSGMMKSAMGGPSGWMKMPARGMHGAMKDMGMDPVKLMLRMCGSGSGKMGASMFNSFGGMMPGANEEMVNAMRKMMYNPGQVHRAIHCASKNYSLFKLMEKAINIDRSMLYYMGGQMIVDKYVALELMRLAQTPAIMGSRIFYPAAEMLLRKMDPVHFSQFTYAMHMHPEIVLPLLKVIESNKALAFSFKGNLMRSLMHWGDPLHSADGTEASVERFVSAVMGQVETANKFFEIMESLDKDTKEALLDIIFLGERFDFDPYQQKYVRDKSHSENSSHLHIYALVDGLYKSLLGDLDEMPESPKDVAPEAMKLMMGMMKYMVDENHKPTRWAGAFIQGLGNAVVAHSLVPMKNGKAVFNFCSIKMTDWPFLDNPDYRPSRHQVFYCLLNQMMKRVPQFQSAGPTPDFDSIAPRDYVNGFPPVIPQTGRRGPWGY